MPTSSALETLGQYIDESRRLLQDEFAPYRYPDDDLVDALNIGMQEVRRLRADLFLPMFELPWTDATGTIDRAATVTMDPMYRPALIYYVVGRLQLRDDEPTVDSRAAALLQKFAQQLLTTA
jgi:hypothetical protein